mmetsp:Transcript_34538/g.97421  ORF Transcript_34538/g.97421 Transcript_34538/m.97421 type:complete len:248 (-) Transcript_34538:16-759(-)
MDSMEEGKGVPEGAHEYARCPSCSGRKLSLPPPGAGGGRRLARACAVNRVLLALGGGVVLLFVMEVMLCLALLIHPVVDLVGQLTYTLRDASGPGATFSVSLGQMDFNAASVNMDMGGMGGAGGAGPALPPAGAAPPEADAQAVIQSLDAESRFVEWCLQADCAQRFSGRCREVEEQLLTGQGADGAPVLPLPPEFCEAVATINDEGCLCDPQYFEVPGTDQMLEFLTLLGPMCRFQPVAAELGNCR